MIQDKDKGWKKIVKSVKEIETIQVKAGLLKNVGKGESAKTNIAERGATHEFGSKDGRIPERSFMRSSFDENQKYYHDFFNIQFALVKLGKISGITALKRLGVEVVSKIKNKINTGNFKELKPATIARKRSSKPLIDKVTMLNSIQYELVKRKI